MASEQQKTLEVEKAEVPSSPGQATPNQVDPQPSSTTPDKPLGACSRPVSDTAYKVDEESCNTESELRRLSFICHAYSHNNQGPQTKTLITRLKLAIGLTDRPTSNITHDYRMPTITIPREAPEGRAARNMLIWQTVNDYQRGYGTVAAFEDCDPCFLMYRKFGWLHNRLLLHLQDELSVLEKELEDFDKDEAIYSTPLYQRSRRADEDRPDSKRRIMLQVIKEKLEEYGEFARQ